MKEAAAGFPIESFKWLNFMEGFSSRHKSEAIPRLCDIFPSKSCVNGGKGNVCQSLFKMKKHDEQEPLLGNGHIPSEEESTDSPTKEDEKPGVNTVTLVVLVLGKASRR